MAKKQKQKRFREMHDVYGRTIFFSHPECPQKNYSHDC